MAFWEQSWAALRWQQLESHYMQVLWKPQRDKHLTKQFSISLLTCAPWTKNWASDLLAQWQTLLGNTFLGFGFCTSRAFLPASCAPCWRGQIFYSLLRQFHRILCRLQVFSGKNSLPAKGHYHLSKIKTELKITVLVVRTKPVLFKETQTESLAPSSTIRTASSSQDTHKSTTTDDFVGDGNFPCFCIISKDSW